MAGPGIRAFHFAEELGREADVTLVARFRDFEARNGWKAVDWDAAEARDALRDADVLVAQPRREILKLRHRRAIYDLFDPVVLELDELLRAAPSYRLRLQRSIEWSRLALAIERGWRLIAATPQQRDFYLGVHASRGSAMERWGERWLEVPFGADRAGSLHPPAVTPAHPMVLWGGGTWEWLDAELAVAAVERLDAVGVDVRLLFLGSAHPNPEVRDRVGRPVDGDERLLIRNDEWVPYAERGRWVSAARASLMLHKATAEAEAAIRTRLFDAIAFEVPVVATRGGWTAELVEREGLGVVVEPGSLVSAAAGIRLLVEDDAFHAGCVLNLERLRPRFAWSEVVRPLVEAIARR